MITRELEIAFGIVQLAGLHGHVMVIEAGMPGETVSGPQVRWRIVGHLAERKGTEIGEGVGVTGRGLRERRTGGVDPFCTCER